MNFSINKITKVIIFLFVISFLTSCDEKVSFCYETITIDQPVSFERVESEFLKIKDSTDFQNFLKKHPLLGRKFLFSNRIPHDKLVPSIIRTNSNPHMDTLMQEVEKSFGSMDVVGNNLSKTYARLTNYDSSIVVPKVKTMVTGFVQGCDLALVNRDSTLLLGLDWFLNTDAKYRAPSQPKYILDRLTSAHLPAMVSLIYSNRFNKIDSEDKTVLAEMIYYGKAYEFVKQMNPCMPDSLILGYTSKEMEVIDRAELDIWNHFRENQILFKTDKESKQTYVLESPKVAAIADNCPGRIGRMVGWEIVKGYLQNKKISLKELMKEVDAQKILEGSKYRPQN